jgi:hypothetical protein
MAEEHESTNVPAPGTGMFGVPVTPRAGELVRPTANSLDTGRPFQVREVSQGTGDQYSDSRTSKPAAGDSSSTLEPADLVTGIQQRQAERERLLGLCRSLRASHRCPGRCVFTGELRQTGVQAFWNGLDGGR